MLLKNGKRIRTSYGLNKKEKNGFSQSVSLECLENHVKEIVQAKEAKEMRAQRQGVSKQVL